jgi:hypothetical protein
MGKLPRVPKNFQVGDQLGADFQNGDHMVDPASVLQVLADVECGACVLNL